MLQTYNPMPREKIQSEGVELLSTHELLSVILGSGSKYIPVQMLAKKIEVKLSEQHKLRLSDLIQIKGVGIAKACQVLAAIELVERLRPAGNPLIDTLDKVLTQLGDIRYEPREHIVCLYLNARLQLVLKETLSIGSMNQAHITPRDIFSAIKYHPVLYLVLAHNHPSGNPSPSDDDLTFTEQITDAADLLGIHVLDHVIVGHDRHFSCKEMGVMKNYSSASETVESNALISDSSFST